MKTLIFDGQNAMYRLVHKLPVLTANGRPIQLVYGFLRLLRSNIERFDATGALVCWDKGIPTIRTEIWDGYKKHRIQQKAEPDKKQQMGVVNSQIGILGEILPRLGVAEMSVNGLEADDIMALASSIDSLGERVIISSDQDMLQLVSHDISVHSPVKNVTYTTDNFHKLVGLSPKQYLEMRALTGDSGDGIPGVAKGFGEKTARELIQKYGSGRALFTGWAQKKLENRSSRYKLLYADGVEDIFERNLKLMDLGLMKSETAKNQIAEKLSGPLKIDTIGVQRYFREQQFNSMLENFLVWITPFKSLERS